MRRPKFNPHSLKDKMLLWAFILILPILLIFTINSFRIAAAFEQLTQRNIEQMLGQYIAEIDSMLIDAKQYIANRNVVISSLNSSSTSELDRLNNSIGIGSSLSEDLAMHNQIDAVFLYDLNDRLVFVQNYNRSFPENFVASGVIKEQLKSRNSDNEIFRQGFLYFTSENKGYVFIARNVPGGLFGCWIQLDTLFSPIHRADINGLEKVMFADRTGLYLDEDFNSRSSKKVQEALEPYFITREQLRSAPYALTVLWNPNVVFAPVNSIILRTVYLSIGAAILLFLTYVLFLHRQLIQPINRLIDNIKDIRSESPTFISVPKNEDNELRDIYLALNAMIQEVQSLKIIVYEERLARQNTQLQLYQLQIRPHFFINVLNTIVSFARAGEYDLVSRLTTYLANHSRYILYNTWFVTVEEELSHTQNYINILTMQHEKTFSYSVCAANDVLDLEIPILAVQVFVENSLKYTGSLENPTLVEVLIERAQKDNIHYLHIIISDSGKGFDEKMLEMLQDKQFDPYFGKYQGIGIANVRQRLMILYEGKAEMSFSNSEKGGANVEMYLPIAQERCETIEE